MNACAAMEIQIEIQMDIVPVGISTHSIFQLETLLIKTTPQAAYRAVPWWDVCSALRI